MSIDYLAQFVEQLTVAPEQAATELGYLAGYQRGVKVVDAPVQAIRPTVSVEEARRVIWQEMTEYAHLVNPQHILLIKAQPGVGKTHAGVRLAEMLAG